MLLHLWAHRKSISDVVGENSELYECRQCGWEGESRRRLLHHDTYYCPDCGAEL